MADSMKTTSLPMILSGQRANTLSHLKITNNELMNENLCLTSN